jgi:hypothetical protein
VFERSFKVYQTLSVVMVYVFCVTQLRSGFQQAEHPAVFRSNP